jgi:ribosomal protein S27AE
MTALTLWQTDDQCPDCGTTMTLAEDGSLVQRSECRSCGRADTWTSDHPAGGDQ